VLLTRQGWFVAAAAAGFLVAGWLFGSDEMFLVGGTLLALVLTCVGYVALSRLRIDVTRELHPPRVHAGSPSRVDLRVENTGRRPTPVLGLRDAVSGTRGANLLVGPLAGGQVERAAYRLPTDKRGILEIGPLRVEMADPFGIARITMTASGVSELTVYPHTDTIVPVPLTSGNDPMAGAEHPNALGRSGEDFYALRHYQVGDDLRRVHWPSTAKHDELMVRQDEQPWQGRATVLCDIRAATNTEESLELVISAAASIVTASSRRQDLVRLLTTNGSDSGFAAGHAHVEAIMETLVSAEASHDAAFRRVIDRAGRSSTGGALIAIVANMPPSEIERVSRLRQRFGSVTIVQFTASSWDPRAPTPNGTAPPGVLRVTHQSPFVETWDKAMSRRNRRRDRDQPWRSELYDATIPPASFDPFARRGGPIP
jgi:uncharacterized protein (DUF58 family)